MPRLVRPLLVAALLIASIAGTVGCRTDGPAAPGADGTSIVLVTIDTLRADHLGAYGYPRPVSPFLDRLAESAVIFDRAVSASSHTAPSHASLFTGRYPQQHQLLLNGEPLPNGVPTLVEHLSESGYLTAAFPSVGFLGGLRRGFDSFDAPPHYRPAAETLGAAADWLRRHAGNGTFFVWIHLFDVHEWYKPQHRHDDVIAELRQRTDERQQLLDFLIERHAMPLAPFQTPEQALERIDAYDGQLLATDRALERFWEETTDLALHDDAIWIITSDHGEGLGNHQFLGHGKHLYNEQLLVPLLIRFPDLEAAGRRVGRLVRLVDLAPTVLELAHAAPFDGPTAGRSVLSLLVDDTDADTPPDAYSERPPATERALESGWRQGEVIALQSPRYKLILHSWGEPELYDLARDPHELRNLVAMDGSVDSPLATTFARLESRLRRAYRAMQRVGATLQRGDIADRYREELRALGYL